MSETHKDKVKKALHNMVAHHRAIHEHVQQTAAGTKTPPPPPPPPPVPTK